MDYSSTFADRQHVVNKHHTNAGGHMPYLLTSFPENVICKAPVLAGNGGNRFYQLLCFTLGSSMLSCLNPLHLASSVINWLKSEFIEQTNQFTCTKHALRKNDKKLNCLVYLYYRRSKNATWCMMITCKLHRWEGIYQDSGLKEAECGWLRRMS